MKNQRSMQPKYNLIQILFWVTVGFMFAYASVYLQDRGVPNSQIGLILGASYGLAALVQPMIAAVVDRWKIPLIRMILLVQCAIAALSLLLFLLKLPNWIVGILMVAAFSLHFAIQASVNSLAQLMEQEGYSVNFGISRGLGSLFYAILMAITGQLLQRVSSSILPLGYFTATVLNMLVLLSLQPLRRVCLAADSGSADQGFPSVKEYPFFWVFLVSVLFLAIGEGMTSNFLLQIMQNVGGDSGSVGIAIAICAGLEFPSMTLYSRFSKRFGVHRLLIGASWIWIVKIGLFFLAKSPQAIMAAYVLQFFTYAIYIPGSIDFVGKIMPERLFLKAQSLAVSVYTLGCVFATFFGGLLLDGLGVHRTLFWMLCSVILGAVLMTFGVTGSRKRM